MLTRTGVITAIAGAALAVSALSPMAAQAASLTPTQIGAITNLLQAFGADPAVVANVEAVLNGTAPTGTGTTTPVMQPANPTDSSGASCAVLSANLRFGSEGEDVSRLQSFLSKDPSIYPEGLVTGHFGPATEDAVQRWQAAHNIIATGTPITTGFGFVGPSTRHEMDAEMETECEGGDHLGAPMASSTPPGFGMMRPAGDN